MLWMLPTWITKCKASLGCKTWDSKKKKCGAVSYFSVSFWIGLLVFSCFSLGQGDLELKKFILPRCAKIISIWCCTQPLRYHLYTDGLWDKVSWVLGINSGPRVHAASTAVTSLSLPPLFVSFYTVAQVGHEVFVLLPQLPPMLGLQMQSAVFCTPPFLHFYEFNLNYIYSCIKLSVTRESRQQLIFFCFCSIRHHVILTSATTSCVNIFVQLLITFLA